MSPPHLGAYPQSLCGLTPPAFSPSSAPQLHSDHSSLLVSVKLTRALAEAAATAA